MGESNLIKSSQEQAVASWVNYLNQLRLDYLTAFMQQQDKNLEAALEDISAAMNDIRNLMESNRGGVTGMHGFIAEIAEVGIGNARQNIVGNTNNYIWSNDNGAVDLVREGIDIQLKFYQSRLSLGAITTHLQKYPDFIKNGGKYQIPKDQYEKIKYLLSVTKEQVNKMPTSDDSFPLKQWKIVNEFFETNEIKFEDVEPSALNYKDVQRNQIEFTMQNESENIKDTDKQLRNQARQKSMPTIKEGVKVTIISAVIEGGTALGFAIASKKKEGKDLRTYTADDWYDILGATGKETLKGSIRGTSIYALTNYTATPAAVASALVTASFGVAEQAHLFRKGELTEVQFIENSEMLCLDAAVSALSSFIGQVFIPIPVLGVIIGNAVGTTMYKIVKDNFTEYEQKLIKNYMESINKLGIACNEQYAQYIDVLNKEFSCYLEIIEQLYSWNIMDAFDGSIKLAKRFGIPAEEILDTKEKIQSYFDD
jgi:hypothetical protein